MTNIESFLEESGLTTQFQDRVIDIVNTYGKQALESDNFRKTVVSFVSTVVISYVITNVTGEKSLDNIDELQQFMNKIIEQISPSATGTVMKIEPGEDTDKLMEMYSKASANTLPC